MIRSTPREFVAARIQQHEQAGPSLMGVKFGAYETARDIEIAIGQLIEEWERHKGATDTTKLNQEMQ